jgi:type IV secretory pathway VirB3-like protein
MLDDDLDISTIYTGLTRKILVGGIDYTYFMMMWLIVILLFINTGNFLMILMALPLYLVGYMLCKADPDIFSLVSARAGIGSVKNKRIWGCQSYEAK